jgi:ribosomal protein L15
MFLLNQLPKINFQKPKRVGRGGKHGKNAGAGNKGQLKRGGKSRLGFEGNSKSLIRRTPKSKGYNFKPLTDRQRKVVTISALNLAYENDETISMQTLLEKKLIDEKIKKVRNINTGS